MRKIGVVTGTRAEYGLMRSFLKQIQKKPKLKLTIFVTEMHLMEKHGRTVEEIKKDFAKKCLTEVKMSLGNDSKEQQAKYLANGIEGNHHP